MHLRRPVTKGAGAPLRHDEEQALAIASRADLVRVLGAPGTGKSTVAVAAVLDRVRRGECRPDEVLLVAATRLAAAEARDAVTAGLTTQVSPAVADEASDTGAEAYLADLVSRAWQEGGARA